ncbi:membrane protein, putative [Arcticibacter svalbardensis MN12-7]|uniref:Membrane protein, putative n=1 Tax=Arcticibacter svalbardensis MN12-7 TaxID=1150600 RepID=R9GN25_9SPHI|nr:DUF2723 domain-containing protein [Arcticibacter svalbardensis]EOR92945.1 membrane protein, putative [Arcticibacter svalbardensis MN12-7]
MILSKQQQAAVRSQISKINILPERFDEMYDHVLTSLEQKPVHTAFNIKMVQDILGAVFADLVHTEKEWKRFKKVNLICGFVLFGMATLIYWLTMEPTVSFWDCGEFIAASYKLQVGHQPGAPLFLIIGKLFSMLSMGDTGKIAYWINFSSVLASGATIMFLFWTITALSLRLYENNKKKIQVLAIISAGVVGAMAYAFSDTFWFSAVESEVYSLSTLFTAIVFWAILKWEAETNDRWLIFIAFMVGLSIGVHLLSLLAIPAVTLVYYFKKNQRSGILGIGKAFLTGCFLVGVVQFIIIQYFVLFAAHFDLFFVNTLGLDFGSGALFFVVLLGGLLAGALYYSILKNKYNLNLSLLCLVFILLGFSSYLMIYVRANAKPNINLSNPDNAFSLYNYLGRSNYGETPLVYGNTFDAKLISQEQKGPTYRKGNSSYEISGYDYKRGYDKNVLFPRTYSTKPYHPDFYKQWLNLAEGETPSFGKNIQFFTSWQLGFMYWRYFLWNFVGRQNDIQGQGEINNGNWISGIKPLDALRLGNQSNLPPSITSNAAHNVYYGLPLLLGFAGLFYLYRKNKRDAVVLISLFFFTGIAIILYLNQDPLQVRERDYAYVGSFYAFAICIGLGVLAIKELLSKVSSSKWTPVLAAVICFLAVPVLMGANNWDDHNRSNKTTALNWAKNYLNSCAPNAILFTNADNDTFPLWYAQEVEGIRTDIRVICIQFLGDDAYVNQMKKASSLSAPLPISMPDGKYVEGVRDYIPFVDYGLIDSAELKDLLAVMTSDKKEDQVQMQDGSFMNFLPTRKLKLTVNREEVLKTNTLTANEIGHATDAIEWKFNQSFVSKADLVMFDILAHNDWKRPVYFATSVSQDTYLGLDQYLYLEGYAYRLLPLKVDQSKLGKTDRTHTEVMYANMMNKFDFTSLKKAGYLDPESRRVLNSTWGFANTLAENLIEKKEIAKAHDVMQKCIQELPSENSTIADTLNKINTIRNLYKCKDAGQANVLANQTFNFLDAELTYITSLQPEFQHASLQDIRIGLYVLDALDEITAEYKDEALNKLIKGNTAWLEQHFQI